MESPEYANLAWALLFGHVVLIVIGAFITILSESLVRALVGLIMTLFGVAGLFFLMAAPFIALMQLLIYVGAVSVLIFFAIMLTSSWPGGDESEKKPRRRVFFASLAGLAPAVFLSIAAISTAPPSFLVPEETEVRELGRFLMEPFIVPFELISLLLTVAMAGAVILGLEWRRRRK